MNTIIRSSKQALLKTNIYLGVFSVLITIIGIYDLDKIFPDGDYISRVLCIAGIFVSSYAIALIQCYFARNKKINVGNDRVVSIEYGSIFDKDAGVVVIPFNRYFDTEVNETIISQYSLAGQFIKKEFAGNLKRLDALIDLSTGGLPTITRNDKLGKKNAYPIGTIVKIQQRNTDYFLVAQTEVDKDNKSQCDIEMLHTTLLSLLRFINKEANGQDVYIPLLGAGFTRLHIEKQTILEYIIAVIKATEIPFRSRLHIVLLKKDREFLDLTKRF
jgi:hypothetical protein